MIMQLKCAVLLVIGMTAAILNAGESIINVAAVLPNDGKTDVAGRLQALIRDNPNRTIYFPDGVYRISRPICTPADPHKSVHLKLANHAVIQAVPEWKHREAMIRLGAIHPANDIFSNGSVYGLEGGIINGGGMADGIAIEGGRETVIRNCSLKNVRVGIHIKPGANSGSSDADIMQVNIVGSNAPDSIGLLVDGHDNTFTNMRIAAVHTGVKLNSSGNCLRNIHPLQISRPGMPESEYQSGKGFTISGKDNILDFCYSDNFATAFEIADGQSNTFNNCFCFWYAATGKQHTAICAAKAFNSVFTNFRVRFRPGTVNRVLDAPQAGKGILRDLIFAGTMAPNDAAKKFIK